MTRGIGIIQVGELELAMRELKQATLVLLKKKERRQTALPLPAQPEVRITSCMLG